MAANSDGCVLCGKEIIKPTDRNLVSGKSNARKEIENLPFDVLLLSDYICKSCLAKLRKRNALKEKLDEITTELRDQYYQQYYRCQKSKEPYEDDDCFSR